MSAYTDARSKPGAKGAAGTDDRQLYLVNFSGMVTESYMEAVSDYDSLRFEKTIKSGKADSFPIIGRKRDATEHEPGEQILGGGITHDEITITVDKVLVDSAFIAEIDEHLIHYDLGGPYARQIGQSLGVTNCRRIAIMHILASRGGVTGPDQPVPAYYWAADLRTNPAKMEEAAGLARTFLLENDISGEKPELRIPHAQYMLLTRYTGFEGGPVTTGSGDRAAGTIGQIQGLRPSGTNFIPKTNITTGNSKYQGDFTDTVGHISSRMAVGTLNVRGIRMVMKEQEDRLGTLIIGSMLNGHGKLRNECAIELRISQIGGRTGKAAGELNAAS